MPVLNQEDINIKLINKLNQLTSIINSNIIDIPHNNIEVFYKLKDVLNSAYISKINLNNKTFLVKNGNKNIGNNSFSNLCIIKDKDLYPLQDTKCDLSNKLNELNTVKININNIYNIETGTNKDNNELQSYCKVFIDCANTKLIKRKLQTAIINKNNEYIELIKPDDKIIVHVKIFNRTYIAYIIGINLKYQTFTIKSKYPIFRLGFSTFRFNKLCIYTIDKKQDKKQDNICDPN